MWRWPAQEAKSLFGLTAILLLHPTTCESASPRCSERGLAMSGGGWKLLAGVGLVRRLLSQLVHHSASVGRVFITLIRRNGSIQFTWVRGREKSSSALVCLMK